MPGPFDVTEDNVQLLNDDQLREVLRLLLEAEARQRGVSLACVFIGGDQNAGDGGVDGRIEWVGDPEPSGWIPCRKCLFQSKAETMAAGKLKNELAPNGVVREFFEDLARVSGAYIVFSTDNCSDRMYRLRIAAMHEIVANVPLSGQINFEFYDASRIARWVNCFHGVAHEVRNLIGRPMAGWHPLENWSAPNLDVVPAYLLDDQPKVVIDSSQEQMIISEAIDAVRELIRNHESSTRLIGLSGVGKTRFAQALFDDQVGHNALNPAFVVYGDLGQSPTVTPTQIAEQLTHTQQDAVLIVDNCPGETHRALTQLTQQPGRQIGLLTIDFDVGPDRPDNTQVVQLHRNGNELIEALLHSRVPTLSPQDRIRVVEFADGNARVALAIATNGGEGEGLAELTDQQLIDRLFLEGRRPNDDTLRQCAEVASLVYAFHVEAEGDQEAEHPILAELAEVTPTSFYGKVAECVERGTAQKRGTQRAILPHALAIKLAIRALDRLPPDMVLAHFSHAGRERLFKSFTRRLGALHQSEPAQRIAQILMEPNGQLGDLTTFTADDFSMFFNLAPVAPDLALAALERAVSGPAGSMFVTGDAHPQKRELATLARNLAYDTVYFDRAAHVLLTFAKGEAEGENYNAVRPQFFEMFWINLSWTQAPMEQRYRFIDQMLASSDDVDWLFAIKALSHALDTGPKSSSHDGRFGSRSRGKEWKPTTAIEQTAWFCGALERLVPIACQDGEVSVKARSAMSPDIRDLIRIGLHNEIAGPLRRIRQAAFWSEGWRSLCMAMHYNRNGWPLAVQEQMDQLERDLRPATVDERFSTFVLGEPWGIHPPTPDDGEEDEVNITVLAERLGQEVSTQAEVWCSMARRACAQSKQSSCEAFGRGLGQGMQDMADGWAQLVEIFRGEDPETRNPEILCGYLQGVNDRAPVEVQGWLNEAIASEVLGPHIVELSANLPIGQESIERLNEAVRLGLAPISRFGLLSSGGRTAAIPVGYFAAFLRELLNRNGEGGVVAADILYMYFWGRREQPNIAPELISVGCELLLSPDLYRGISANDSHRLSTIAGRCLIAGETEAQAREIWAVLIDVAQADRSLSMSLEDFIQRLAEIHPSIALDTVFESDEIEGLLGERMFGYSSDDLPGPNRYPINENTDVLMDWVNENPEIRAPQLARHVCYIRQGEDENLSWSLIASELINLPEMGVTVLNIFYERFGTGMSRGPWHFRYLQRRSLIEGLIDHPDPAVQAWATETLVRLDVRIEEMIAQEHHRDERFE